ncbi:hypothetical protein AKJ08_1068 [Vulgatibacter incomptus]|uniref:Choice-of-anchor D domain-containing protein n=1 Tax=Vulgatibacter incomptus TaxID=1391653 RepID=A0A0K1PB85_9BACT|nr:hypothetical protein AKJ08_1068 [Vulgatibacter incomptus]
MLDVEEPIEPAYGLVCNESKTAKTYLVRNLGRSSLSGDVKIEGPDAAFFNADPDTFSVGPSGSASVVVTYSPTGNVSGKKHRASIVFTSTGGNKDFPLGGEVSTVPVAPALSFNCGDSLDICESAGIGVSCCQAAKPEDKPATKHLNFGKIALGQVRTAAAKVANLGCDDLQVTNVKIEKLPGDNCGDDEVKVKGFSSFTLVGSPKPESVATRDVVFEFAPNAKACQVNRKYVITTNDPAAPADSAAASGVLSGSATAPDLVITPDPADFGGVSQGQSKDLDLLVRNSGSESLTISSMEIIEDPANEFSIEGIHRCTTDLPATNNVLAPATADPDRCLTDKVEVKVRYAPSLSHSANAKLRVNHPGVGNGATTADLLGKSTPKLTTHPSDMVLFAAPGNPLLGCGAGDGIHCTAPNCADACTTDGECAPGRCLDGVCDFGAMCVPACGVATRTVAICNGASAVADLVIQPPRIRSNVGDPNPPVDGDDPAKLLFTLTNNCPGRAIQPGTCCNETLTYNDSRFGGTVAAELVIDSNDGTAGGPDGGPYVLLLQAQSLGSSRIPVPDVTAPSNPQKDTWVRLDGSPSSVGLGTITQYHWRLIKIDKTTTSRLPIGGIDPNDPNRNCPPDYNGGQCFRFTDGSHKALEFFADMPGPVQYTFGLMVDGSICDPVWTSLDNEARVIVTMAAAPIGDN